MIEDPNLFKTENLDHNLEENKSILRQERVVGNYKLE